MGQTVNLLAQPSVVRIHLFPPNKIEFKALFFCNCGSSSSGRATAFQAVGGGFESRFSLKMMCRCSSVVEHFLGKEEVMSSILINGSAFIKRKLIKLKIIINYFFPQNLNIKRNGKRSICSY
jgi:hypothetical protein